MSTYNICASNEYPQCMFSSRNKKNVNFRANKSWLDKWVLMIIKTDDPQHWLRCPNITVKMD